jgi:hypothetical protein
MASPIDRFRAKWQLGFLPPERVPAAATELLLDSIESNSLAILAGLTLPTRLDVAPLVERLASEQGMESMSDDEARWLLVRAGVEAISAGTLAPRTGADQIAALCTDLEMPEMLRSFVYYSADYVTDDPLWDERIRETAAEVAAVLRDPAGGVT